MITRFYKCIKCGNKVHTNYLAQHWLRSHFDLMYLIVEYETQTVFELNTDTGETVQSSAKTKDEIEKEYGFRV